MAEQAIDEEHRQNLLSNSPFPIATWNYLAFCEDQALKSVVVDGIDNRQDMACWVDNFVCDLKIPLRWLSHGCQPGNAVSQGYKEDTYQASWDLWKLARNFGPFERAYIYARAGAIGLEVRGDTLIADSPFLGDSRYEAYERLFIPHEAPVQSVDSGLPREIARTVSVHGDRFTCGFTASLVDRAYQELSPMLCKSYWLPSDWQLPRYSLAAFRHVFGILQAFAFVQHFARESAAAQGCIGLGIVDSVLLFDPIDLCSRIRDLTGLDADTVHSIAEDLTFCARGICNPDPALQPLIALTPNCVAVSPSLMLGLNAERNLTVLLNRLPDEKAAYSRLGNGREECSRRRIKEALGPVGLRFWSGRLPLQRS